MSTKVKGEAIKDGSIPLSALTQDVQNTIANNTSRLDTIEQKLNSDVEYNMVDLGLPSGLKWADRNIGAASIEDNGLYFAWGETTGYTAEQVGTDKVFNNANYFDSSCTKYNNEGGLTTLELSDDAARANMGSNWRMPTHADITELINNTTATFIDVNGNEGSNAPEGELKGIKLTSKTNSNSIFIPAAGYCFDSLVNYLGSYGYLWSSSLFEDDSGSAWNLLFYYGGDLSDGIYVRYIGRCVRGVYDETIDEKLIPDTIARKSDIPKSQFEYYIENGGTAFTNEEIYNIYASLLNVYIIGYSEQFDSTFYESGTYTWDEMSLSHKAVVNIIKEGCNVSIPNDEDFNFITYKLNHIYDNVVSLITTTSIEDYDGKEMKIDLVNKTVTIDWII